MINEVDFPYFKEIRFINDPRQGIAKTKRSTGELVINVYYWKKLKPEHKFYILAHEEGHIARNTRDEMTADEYALKKYLAAGLRISEAVRALTNNLNNNSPVHIARAWLQYQRALKYDFETNKNPKAYRPRYDTADDVKRKLVNNVFN